ncbi:MAG: HEAT repeat domain-containing protein [Actinomycetota bacterium]|nr:HEAT repeat domain-containing protein [Actinomycetota bacterium]
MKEEKEKQHEPASSGETLPQELVRHAILSVINLHAATVNMRLYPSTSSMVTETVDKTRECLEEAFSYSDHLSVSVVENGLLVNEQRLEEVEQQKAPVRAFAEWMMEKGLTNIEFHKGVTSDEIKVLLELLSELPENRELGERLNDELSERGVQNVSVNRRVYIAVEAGGEAPYGVGRQATPLDALKDELLVRYLMGKVDVGEVGDEQVVEILSDSKKVGGLLSAFLAEEGAEGGVLVRSESAEKTLRKIADMVSEVKDEALKERLSESISEVIAEMDPSQMTSILTGNAPQNLDLRRVRENVIAMISDNNLLEIVDSLIDEYEEMESKVGELGSGWVRERLEHLNELLVEVRDSAQAKDVVEKIDGKLDEAGIPEERDPHTGKRVLSVSHMLGGPLEEEEIELEAGLDQTVSWQVRKLYDMGEEDLAAGSLLKLSENLESDSEKVRRYASRLLKETLEGLDLDQRLLAGAAVLLRLEQRLPREDDYETFVHGVDCVSMLAEAHYGFGNVEEAVRQMGLLKELSSEESRGEELARYASSATDALIGSEGILDFRSIVMDEEAGRRRRAIRAIAKLGPNSLSHLVELLEDRGDAQIRERASQCLVDAGEAGIEALANELEKDRPWYVYRNLLQVIAEMGLTQAEEAVVRKTEHPDERVRHEALKTIVRLSPQRAMELLTRAARDRSVAVRKTAIRLLGGYRDPRVSSLLLELVEESKSSEGEAQKDLLETICFTLGELGDRRSVNPLIEIARRGGIFRKGWPDEVRAAATMALGNIGDESAISVLKKNLKDPSMAVRAAAGRALDKFAGKQRGA